ncbi:stage III sporulation protein AA [Desulfuribacillus alkaliarsenatis]|uniref:Stage III sporulation protein AA n=1 Tax=Desulfuribacillus alkaliarsenatis TaxID=766136 RepID=A0A1E5G5G6_9FIRM|nr:stage III sporulation protein AA [Desulfuribacillus alkaliarsenatis]OEF98430.1 stage III sporulation protein AA [Desulfuribacillus alkaliarsenatis]
MWSQGIERILPKSIKRLLLNIPKTKLDTIQEIRLRIYQPLEICLANTSVFLSNIGITADLSNAYKVTKEDCNQLLQAISNHSMYAIEDQLRQGYVTISGGHRVGIVGKVVADGGHIRTIQNISSFNIRVAKQITGVATKLMPELYDSVRKQPYHTLIVSPPQCGKTTLLRDIIREFSRGNERLSIPSYKIAVVDERSELAGSIQGVTQADLGPRTDVLDACPKAEGMMLLIRSMSPQIIAVDEIGSKADANAVDEVLHAGVSIITTAHAFNLEELMGRPIMNEMIQKKVFDRYIVLSNRPEVGTITGIYDKNRMKLSMRRAWIG